MLYQLLIFTARCTLVQSAVFRSHIVCLSVRPYVMLVNCDHIGWNSSKIISPLVSLGRSLFATPTWRDCSKGNTPKFGPKVTHPPVDLSIGDIRSQIAAEWLQIAQRSQWRAHRKPPSLFLMVPSLTPYDLPCPQNGGSICPNIRQWPIGHISATGDPIHFMFGARVGFSGMADWTALFTVGANPRWRPSPCCKNFKWRYLRNQSPDPLRFKQIQDGGWSWKNFKWPSLCYRSSDPLHVLLQGGVFGDGGSNCAIFDSNKFQMVATAILDTEILNGHISKTAHDLLI